MKKSMFIIWLMLSLLHTPTFGSSEPRALRLTPNTFFVHKSIDNFNYISDPSEGIFSVQETSPDFGLDTYYSFYTIDGRYLFGPEWLKAPSSEEPRFDNGAAIALSAKKNDEGKQTICILYSDGSVKELAHNCTGATQFFDGVAKIQLLEDKSMRVRYINTLGDEVWPHLGFVYTIAGRERKGSFDIIEGMRYVREGLRAYFDNSTGRWGYLNEKGVVAIPAKYGAARDFANGYALVKMVPESGRPYLAYIDKNGREVVKPAVTTTIGISDIDHGIFSIRDYQSTRYYDIHGELLKQVESGFPFYFGYAFAKLSDDYDAPYYVLNTDFDPKRCLYTKEAELDYNSRGMAYSQIGLVTADQKYVYTANGELRLYSSTHGWGTYDKIGCFSPEGHAKATLTTKTGGREHEFYGITNSEGDMLIVFCADSDAGNYNAGEITDASQRGNGNDDGPNILTGKLPQIDKKPIGPQKYATADYTFTVNVVPEGLTQIAGGGKYKYAQEAHLEGSVPEGWILSDIIIDTPSAIRVHGDGFKVFADGSVTLVFQPVEDTHPGKGTFEGIFSKGTRASDGSLAKIPVYLEMSDNNHKSPYGDNTGGVLVFMSDPKELYTDGALRSKMFSVPMRVQGIMEADGKTWLVFDGGKTFTSNTQVADDGLLGALASAAIAIDGFSNLEIDGGHYRVEMSNINPDTGAFTFGTLQRFSPQYGWVPSGSKCFVKSRTNSFVTAVESGLKPDFFDGICMSPAQPRTDILWYPTMDYFKDANDHASVIKQLEAIYNAFVSDYDAIHTDQAADLTKAVALILAAKYCK